MVNIRLTAAVLQLRAWARCSQLLSIKTYHVLKHSQMSGTWTDTLVLCRLWKRDKTFSTWDVGILYRPGSFMAVARELSIYRSVLVGVQEVGWDKEDTEQAQSFTSLYRKGNEYHQLWT
jgi:hypothetical protein